MTGRPPRIAQECIEGYIFLRDPLRILLFRRRPSRGRIWVPIQGKVDPSDRSLHAALYRELAEETGFQTFRSVAPLRWVVRFRGLDGKLWRLHAFSVELPQRRRPRLNEEHEAFAWLEAPEALRRLHFPDNRVALRRLLRRIGGGKARSSRVGCTGCRLKPSSKRAPDSDP